MTVIAAGILVGCGGEEADQARVIEMQETIISLQEEIAELRAAEPEVVEVEVVREVEVEVCPEPEEVVAEEEPVVEKAKADDVEEEVEASASSNRTGIGEELAWAYDVDSLSLENTGYNYNEMLTWKKETEGMNEAEKADYLGIHALRAFGDETLIEDISEYIDILLPRLEERVHYFGQYSDEIYDYIQHEGYGECWEC
ncbi:hypothetical protein MM300_20205 [Evansella sp. LMS18]|uniref:hypothetical protein n=1 Tax=Evansella sp. LMS18 TaxID=2924033 RepID=UPI0020D194C3|nr:hypothetical protein [Evansella sp. LMS18]UTR10172.1 hypothetical protein MM300_20205 [Evansella sp. LMS18]